MLQNNESPSIFLLAVIVCTAVLPGCGDEDGISNPNSAPEVVSTSPDDHAENASVSTSVKATFNQPIEQSTIRKSTFILRSDSGNVSGFVTATDTTAVFDPDGSLQNGTSYTAILSTDITDATGKELSSEYRWEFRTERVSYDDEITAEEDRQVSFRVRSEFNSGLNEDQGWAGSLNEDVTVQADQPFRLRFEIEGGTEAGGDRQYRLQYRRNGGSWEHVEAADFPDPEEASPRTSVVSVSAYEDGEETVDLLSGSKVPYASGAGVSLGHESLSWSDTGVHSEWEWPLVIRHFADGPVSNNEGDVFEFRMVHSDSRAIEHAITPELTFSVPTGHVGGTFVETPGRLGPWEVSNGDLYFLLEPTVTEFHLMVIKSTDGGKTWMEVDGDNRPFANDMEGFATVRQGDRLHMLHQNAYDVWYHSFNTSDHPTAPDSWNIADERVADPEEPPTQVASIEARSDGSLVAVYGGPEKIHFKTRSLEGIWSEETVVDRGLSQELSGPQTVLGEDDVVHLAYTGDDGTAWYRRIQPDGSLTPREQITTELGTSETDVGSILPLVFIPETNTAVVIYRLSTGRLWERRIIDHGSPSNPVQVTQREVVQSAADSDQTAADAIAVSGNVHVLFIEQSSGNIYHTRSNAEGSWQSATLEVDGVNAHWIRGAPIKQSQGSGVYGFIYDAGSDGGSGMNKYDEIPVEGN